MSTTAQAPAAIKTINLTIDGLPVTVPEGTLVIRAAETIGIEIPRFCDHPLLEPAGACRQCLVEVGTPDKSGEVKFMPKPQASCTMAVSEGMEVKTQLSSPVAEKAQDGVMELLLINHPLDCPVCDKGGECPLQNQAMKHGRDTSRFADFKRTYPKPINISSQVLLDRERCVLCARCTRFSDQIAGDPFIALVERGALQQVGYYETEPFDSYFSGNTVQICPVGALTGAAYRFRSRPFDLVSTPSACGHCASGCALRIDHRRGAVLRQMAYNDPAVNEEWNCDKGRWAFASTTLNDRIEFPMVRKGGELVVTSWPEALEAAARGLAAAQKSGELGVLTGGRVTVEDAYAYSKFARVALGTNSVDFRARPHSSEEADFLASSVLPTSLAYADIESAPAVLLVGLEAEEESPILFLRLRKSVRKNKTKVYGIAPFASRGLSKLDGTLIPAQPGAEVVAIGQLGPRARKLAEARAALSNPASIILVGERMASVPGALSAIAELAKRTGAQLAWVPRRAGERGALAAGALPGLLPGGRLVKNAAARKEVAAIWGANIPAKAGRDAAGLLNGAKTGKVTGLVIGGVDLADFGQGMDTPAVASALAQRFVVSLEQRPSSVTAVADVVLPVATLTEKSGTFLNWEGRERPVNIALSSDAQPDHAVLDMLGSALGAQLGVRTSEQIRAELARVGTADDAPAAPTVQAAEVKPASGQLRLATWRTLLDAGSMQEGEPFLAGTAPRPVARISPATARKAGLSEGELVTVTASKGAKLSVTLPVAITPEMVDDTLWLPTNSVGCDVRALSGASATVSISGGAR